MPKTRLQEIEEQQQNPLENYYPPVGSGTPVQGLMDYDAGRALGYGEDPVGLIEQPVDLDLSQQIVPMTEEQAAVTPVGETPPPVGGPTDADKLAAAQVVLGTGQPAQPQMVDKEIGSTSTTTSQTVESPESKAAQQDVLDAQASAQAASDKEMEAAAAENEARAKRDQQDNEVVAQVEDAKANAILENKIDFDVALQRIEQKQADLASLKPETFWGSKTTADKITAALSVGLGAYGQALLGSGQNVGQVLLERNMQEFDRNQQLVYNNRLKEIEGMKGSLETKRKLADDALDVFDAQKLAGRARVSADNAKALASAKTVQMQSAIAQRQSKMDMDVAKIQGEIARDREQKISTTTERKILEKVMLQSGMDENGKPIKLSEGQATSRILYSRVAAGNKVIDAMDESALVNDYDFKDIVSSERLQSTINEASVLGTAPGKIVTGIGNTLSGGTPRERLSAKRPDIVQYLDAKEQFISGVLRKESGASIAPSEMANMDKQYFPQPGDSPESVKQKAQLRKDTSARIREAGLLP